MSATTQGFPPVTPGAAEELAASPISASDTISLPEIELPTFHTKIETNLSVVEHVASASTKAKPKPKPLTQAELRAKWRKAELDIADTLSPDGCNMRLDVQRALECIAFLMEWPVDCGNESLDGQMVVGLSRAIRLCASQVKKLYERDELQHEIEHCGGDFHKSPALNAIYGRK